MIVCLEVEPGGFEDHYERVVVADEKVDEVVLVLEAAQMVTCLGIPGENQDQTAGQHMVPALYGLVQEIDWLEFLNDLEYRLILWEEQLLVGHQFPQAPLDLV